MHGLKLVSLEPKKGNFKEFLDKNYTKTKINNDDLKFNEELNFDGWKCVDCNARQGTFKTFVFQEQ